MAVAWGTPTGGARGLGGAGCATQQIGSPGLYGATGARSDVRFATTTVHGGETRRGGGVEGSADPACAAGALKVPVEQVRHEFGHGYEEGWAVSAAPSGRRAPGALRPHRGHRRRVSCCTDPACRRGGGGPGSPRPAGSA